MKLKDKIIISGLGILGSAVPAQAPQAQFVQCRTGLIALTALTVPLNYATFSCSTASPGTISVTPSGSTSRSGCVSPVAGTALRARLRVRPFQGSAARPIKVTIPTTATISNGTGTLSVDNIRMNIGTNLNINTLTIPGNSGWQDIFVGGRVSVNSADPKGLYSGAVVVTAECL